jgi:rare lipoprotein A
MKHQAVLAAFTLVLAAGAEQASDKPSPVPRRPVRPSYVSTPADLSGRPVSLQAGAARKNAPVESRAAAETMRETGTACFFSSRTSGSLTASGTHLNSEELVAAHARFPMGSHVRVKNLANGKDVQLRIVDRFPDSSRRVINVSEAAARELGFTRQGTAEVELTLVEDASAAARE